MPTTKEKKALLPELRFPEFEGEWHVQPLEPLIKPHSERVESSTSIPVYSSTREGLQLQSEYYGGNNRANEGTYGVVPDGYFVYRHMSDDGIFKFNINRTGKEIVVSKEYPVFTTKNLNSDFLLHLLDWSPQFKNFCLAQKKGGTRTRLYLSTLGKWKPALPNTDEQQKIADCLGSLDELIAARSAKLAALQDHKKGLLQQLFPAPGETVPKLRFPGFEGEWETKKISGLGDVITGNTPKTSRKEFYGGSRLFVSPADISEDQYIRGTKTTLTQEGFKETRPVPPNSTLFVCIGSTIGKVAQNAEECATNQQINAVVPNSKHENEFVYFLLCRHAKEVAELAGKQAVPIISKSLFSSCKVSTPALPEQQKIADCLSSLDALITAETDHIAALKQHKKGLMQKLFPNPERSKA